MAYCSALLSRFVQHLVAEDGDVEIAFRFRSKIKQLASAALRLRCCGMWQRVCVVQAKRHIHSPRRLDLSMPARMPHRKLVVHRLVRAKMIVQLS